MRGRAGGCAAGFCELSRCISSRKCDRPAPRRIAVTTPLQGSDRRLARAGRTTGGCDAKPRACRSPELHRRLRGHRRLSRLQGLFTAHVTGNFVTLGATLVLGTHGAIAKLLALPEFVLVVAFVSIAADWLARRQWPAVPLLLSAKVALLVAFFALAVALGPFADSDAPAALVTGFAGVAAMGVQNAVQRMHLAGLPPGTLMTGNTRRCSMPSRLFAARIPTRQSAAASTGCSRRSSGLLPVARSPRHFTRGSDSGASRFPRSSARQAPCWPRSVSRCETLLGVSRF
jgi:Protein of unknown function (DUF1275)